MTDYQKIFQEEFRLDPALMYLNHAAVAPWPHRTVKAVCRFAEENGTQGAANYPDWLKTEQKLKKQLQWLINAPSTDDIALLKNTSEAISMVASGIPWRAGENIISSNEEFPSNRIPWQAQANQGIEFRQVDLNNGDSPESALINACDAQTRLLTISSVQYGTGLRLDLEKLGNFCHEKAILFCVDAIQSLGVLPMDVQSIHADFVMADAHKWMLGPEGIALFYCNPEIRDQLKLYQFGWHMVENPGDYGATDWTFADSARRFECGSPNMLGIVALSASLSLFEEIGMETISRNIINNISLLIDLLRNIKDIEFISPVDEAQRAGIMTVKIKGIEMSALQANLMKNKVICAHRAGGIRFSPHFYTSRNNINKAIEIFTSFL